MRPPSKKNAAAIARTAERMYSDGPMCAYRCPFCRGWHIGHDRYV
jgi:hypothetical protein